MPEDEIKSGVLAQVDPKKINRNPHNPRYHFDENKMVVLLQSIKEVGILVPLIVYQNSKDRKIYILDGERRWLCALKLNMSKVPVNRVAEPTTLENLLRMFNIHNVRVGWELMPTALKLEVILRELEKKGRKKVSDKELSLLTGLTQSTVDRCKKLLSFPKKYQDTALERKIPEDFLIEMYPVLNSIEKNLPEISGRYKRDKLTEIFIEKREKKVIKSPIEFRSFRDIIKGLKKGTSKKTVREVVEKIVEDPNYTIDEGYEASVKRFYETKNIEKKCTEVIELLELLEISEISQEEKALILETLQKLERIIDIKIKELT
ncbi:MAG: hypothetical protein COS08_08940 [Euryarchaeota archaeon CG01_land_8_20_14_3_00_38_12]|nr:MAG: hypothetical protein COS08_08940 [Euryarchaeota archaeon CG01_land_8_20_14_3_00_38_12]PJB21517.1 MAG: hypothetical protein CO114_04915 [Euryarchaeota archaeon CG_4_9_14_3_um_filter_38_12]